MKGTNLTVHVPSCGSLSYPIVFGHRHWQKTLRAFLHDHAFSRVGFVVDEHVLSLWKQEIEVFSPDIISLPSGESSKTIERALMIVETLTRRGFDRKSLLIAMGGGVVGDLCGFVASVYMRGIPFVQIPTTVLAIVDSSIGGKTGVDTSFGKNLVGSFHFPSLVIADTVFLQSLPETQKTNGLVEMIKHALILDARYYTRLMSSSFDEAEWVSLLWRSCQIKAHVVQKDPTEKNLRQVLNLGHTIGHALEHAAGYAWLHGYAVAWGIIGEAFLSWKYGYLSKQQLDRLTRDFLHARLLVSPRIMRRLTWEEVRSPLLHDKKNVQGHVHVVLLRRIGEVVTKNKRYSHPVDEASLHEAFGFLQKIAEDIHESD